MSFTDYRVVVVSNVFYELLVDEVDAVTFIVQSISFFFEFFYLCKIRNLFRAYVITQTSSDIPVAIQNPVIPIIVCEIVP